MFIYANVLMFIYANNLTGTLVNVFYSSELA